MKIAIELKNNKYTVSYGTISASGASVKEALDALVEGFRTQIEKFFKP